MYEEKVSFVHDTVDFAELFVGNIGGKRITCFTV